jgi:Tol biopolymer transport system component
VGGAPLGVNALSPDDGRRWNVSRIVDYSYSWAPDGNAIAYAVPRGISVVPLDGGESRQLTMDGGENPVWSPSGSRIAYVGRDHEIWSVRPDGGAPRRLTSRAATAGITFSPNDRWIAYHRLMSDPHLWIIDVRAP